MAEDQSEDILEEKQGSETKKLLLIIIIISVVFLSIMGAGFYILWNRVSPPDPQIAQEESKIKEVEKAKSEIRPIYSLDTFIVNLADRGATRYLRVTMDLELSSDETKAEIENRLPQIRDTILTIVPAKSSKEITTIEGKKALRDEIMDKLNSFLKDGSVTNIYFTEFVIQ
ncbi:MAG: flagellar basal body protein FliL [Deltaproteobacteria bacterium]|nr:MAG: flagellar basal body protein FliL [Deltaproteobacteria bacterium]